MRLTRSLVPFVAALCALTAGATTATAVPEPPSPEVGLNTPAEEAQLQQELAEAKPVIATYKGEKINLADGWQGAQACSEVPSGEVYCYDSAEEADQALAAIAPAATRGSGSGVTSAKVSGELSPTASGDCSFGWVCLWEHGEFTGRRLQWSAKGTKQLGTGTSGTRPAPAVLIATRVVCPSMTPERACLDWYMARRRLLLQVLHRQLPDRWHLQRQGRLHKNVTDRE